MRVSVHSTMGGHGAGVFFILRFTKSHPPQNAHLSFPPPFSFSLGITLFWVALVHKGV
jgi:hypothetical protein